MSNEYPYTTQYPKRRKKWPWVVGITAAALFALCGGAMALGIGGTKAVVEAGQKVVASAEVEAQERAKDVKLTSCVASQVGTVDVKYTIVNHGTTARSYLLTIEATTPEGTRIGTANGFAEDVQPGKTVKGTAVGTLEGKPSKFKCTLLEA